MKREDLKVGQTYQSKTNKAWTRTILMITDSHIFYSYEYDEMIGKEATRIDEFIFSDFEPLREEYFQVFYHKKTAGRPSCHAHLFKSKEDFLTRNGQDKEEFYHWIKLVKVEI